MTSKILIIMLSMILLSCGSGSFLSKNYQSLNYIEPGLPEEVEYIPITREDLPFKVRAAMENRFEGYIVQGVFRGTNTLYRIFLDGQTVQRVVYITEAGIFVNENGEIEGGVN